MTGSSFTPIGLLAVGLLVGWMAGRTVPWPGSAPKNEKIEAESDAVCPTSPTSTQVGEATAKAQAPSSSAAPAANPAAHSDIMERLRTLKIVELRKICETAEDQFLTQKISGYAPALEDMPKNERDQELSALRRQFSTALEQSPYWRTDFSIEAGGDVLYGELVIDLEGNSDVDFKCVAWSFYYELNGQVQRTSLFGASACEGSGVRKRGSAFYLDIATYNFVEIGKRVTDILVPVPPTSDAIEFLRADTENWQSLGSRPWTRITRADYLVWQRKIAEKTGAHP